MLRSNVARASRHLRIRRGWRQSDLAARSGVSREAVSRLERGAIRGMTLSSIERVVAALDATVDLTIRWDGARLDRILDASHALLQQSVAQLFTEHGWVVHVEASFNHYGDRGRIDVIARHPVLGVVVIVEVKSALGDLQDTVGNLDVKVRVAPVVARDLGWPAPRAIVPLLVIGDTRSARRIVASHENLFHRYAVRGRAARAWMRHPAMPPPSGLLWFASLPDSREVTARRTQRVRTVSSDG